jgi:hypothetical protein
MLLEGSSSYFLEVIKEVGLAKVSRTVGDLAVENLLMPVFIGAKYPYIKRLELVCEVRW